MDESQLKTEADKQVEFLRTNRYTLGLWFWRNAKGETKVSLVEPLRYTEGGEYGDVALFAFGRAR